MRSLYSVCLQNNWFAAPAWGMAAIDTPVRAGAECLEPNT